MNAVEPNLAIFAGSDACLALEDGRVFFGQAFGARAVGRGEVVFNTSMAGYQEILTDPSYRGQMVVLTHPQVGNYGVQRQASESTRPWVAALIVRDLARAPNHWLMYGGLDAFLAEAGIPGIQGIDTRALTRHLRDRGTMRAALGRLNPGGHAEEVEHLVELARTTTPLSEQDLVSEVTDPPGVARRSDRQVPTSIQTHKRIAVLDYGIKHNIARSLSARGAEAIVFPWMATLGEVLDSGAEGIVISNGPGDPARMRQAADLTQALLGRRMPLLGICLGHQILGLAAAGTTSRLRFGHHGGNHPVRDLATGQVHITSQNHEFQVDAPSIPERSGFVVSMVNLNDQSVEGLAHRELPAFSVQYHPEGCPGPQDNQYVFERFLDMVERPIPGWAALGPSSKAARAPAAGEAQVS